MEAVGWPFTPLDSAKNKRKMKIDGDLPHREGRKIMRLMDRTATDKEDVRHMTAAELDSLGISIVGQAET